MTTTLSNLNKTCRLGRLIQCRMNGLAQLLANDHHRNIITGCGSCRHRQRVALSAGQIEEMLGHEPVFLLEHLADDPNVNSTACRDCIFALNLLSTCSGQSRMFIRRVRQAQRSFRCSGNS